MNKERTINKENENQREAKWLTTFNDLMTLLLTFFVLIFTMSSIDFKEMKQFKDSLQCALGVLESGDMTEVEIRQFVTDHSIGERFEEEGEVDDCLQALNFEPGIEVIFTQEGVIITFKDTILFKSGRADINPRAFPVLDKVATVIRKVSNPIRIEGHTDNIPIHSNKFPSNWELSTARAVNVLRHFVDVGKINPRRLSAAGYGESKPLFPNDTPEHRARNRRVEIFLMMEEKK